MIVGLEQAPDVTAVIPTLGGKPERLAACLDSIRESEFDGRLSIMVVWNDSRVVVPPWNDVTVLEPGINLGFPGSLLHARGQVTSNFMWVMQDDVVVAPGCLAALWDRLSAPDAPGVVSPVIVNEHGLIPGWSRAGVLDAQGFTIYMFPKAETSPEDLDLDHPVDWVSTSGALVSMKVWDVVGGFDPRFYPLQASDVDFTYRVKAAGHPICLVPSAHITHEVNGSTPSALVEYLKLANAKLFREKHFEGDIAPPTPVAVDPYLVELVAQEASQRLVDFANFVAVRESSPSRGRLLRLLGKIRGRVRRVLADEVSAD